MMAHFWIAILKKCVAKYPISGGTFFHLWVYANRNVFWYPTDSVFSARN